MTSDGGLMSSAKRGDCQTSTIEPVADELHVLDIQCPPLVPTYPLKINSVPCRRKYAFT